jgi:hypothetical protein
MKNLRNGRLGLLETTLIEFRQKGNSSLEEVRQFLMSKYQLTVSNSVLQKRLESLSF